MKYRTLAAAGLCLAAALAACDDTPMLDVCSGVPTPSIRVRVTSAVSAEHASDGARGWWVVGTQTDSLHHAKPDNGYLYGFGPAGAYTVVVQRPGFADWTLSGVLVEPGRCGPVTVEVDARLQSTT